ncbi:MAG: sigma-54-dependent Fis family transcriptional regulator [Bradymonadales bacterium]|nr:sigma-54-dependent Fis family transcriptional regulator [Bradymonadales bacterium]
MATAREEPFTILVIDDSEDYIDLCHEFLRRYRYLTNCDFNHPCWDCELSPTCPLKHAHDWYEFEEIMRRHGGRVGVILLDLHFDRPLDRLIPESLREEAARDRSKERRLKSRQGLYLLEAIRSRYGSIPVVLMTSKSTVGHDDPALASQIEEHRFTEMLGEEGVNAQALAAKIESFAQTRHRAAVEGRFFWGSSPAMERLRRWLEVFAEGDQPILILGETGTGKSYLAEQFIHPMARPDGPFCSLDLSAIPDALVAAELFGTSRGAFSDAVDRPGRFEFAHHGVLFLDEIGNLSPETQKRLLGVLQDRAVTRLGENRARAVDVKLVVATNEDLEARVRTGTFRADLYQRLNPAARIEIPPLRQRLEDLPDLLQVLTDHMFESPGNRRLLARFAHLFQLSEKLSVRVQVGSRRHLPTDEVLLWLTGRAEQLVKTAAWPGNVRQLELVWTNAVIYQLAEQIAAGRVGDHPVISMDAQLLGELISSSSMIEPEQPAGEPREPQRFLVEIRPQKSLNDVSREVEVQYFRDLFLRCGERFERMAGHLLSGDPAANARRVQLRFNNLGLSTRRLRGR